MMVNKKNPLSSLISDMVNEAIISFVGTIRTQVLKPFPNLIKKISKKVMQKYVIMAVFGLAGILLIGFGIAEYLYQWLYEWAYILIGLLLILIGYLQFKR
jgi:putative Mn2+ efflux pump MntP